MATLYTRQDSNIHKTWFLMFFFLLLVIAVGWGISWYFNNQLILYIAVILAVATNFYSYWYSDRLVIRMTRARPVTKEQNEELWDIVENLSITAGLPMPRIYIVDDPAPNAFSTGRDPEHAVVAVTTGILGILDKNELEGVIAHELSHIGNRDILVSTVAVVLAGFIAIIADIFLRTMFWGGGGRNDRNGGGIVVLIVAVVGAILLPIAAQMIQLAISRKREFLADASGVLLTRYPEGLANALRKIGAYAQPMQRTNYATAHLFIANPFGAQGGKFFNKLFSDHPPIDERVKALLNG